MFPADQDIPASTVAVDDVLDARRIVAATGGVDGQTEFFSEWFNGIIRAGTFAIFNLIRERRLAMSMRSKR